MLQGGFRKGRGTRDQIANISWITEEAKELKKLYTSSSTMLKPLTVCIIKNRGKFFKDMNINHLKCLLRNLYARQEATVRTGHGTMDWFKIGKG